MSENPDTDIAEFFRRQAEDITDQSIEAVVEKLRTQRHRWLAGVKDAGTPASRVSKATKAQAEAIAITGDIDVGDLEL